MYKTRTLTFLLFLLLIICISCNRVIEKNKELITATLNAHAATKSLKIKDYKVDDYMDRPDTLFVFVAGHYSNAELFTDTLRYPKTPDGIIISK